MMLTPKPLRLRPRLADYPSSYSILRLVVCGRHSISPWIAPQQTSWFSPDDDTEAYPNWLRLIEEHFLRDLALGGVGGRDEIQYRNRPDLTSPPPTDRIGCLTALGEMQGCHHYPPISDLLEVDCLKGVNMALRRNALGDIRIDDSLRGNFAQVAWEVILTFQLRSRGWKLLFDKHLTIRHWIGPRPLEDSRTALAFETGFNSVYNTTFAIISYGPLLRSLLFVVRAVLTGSRFEPGILGALYLTAVRDTSAWARFRNHLPARLQGCVAGLAGWAKNSHRLYFNWPVARKNRH
jgi:hypothetical protein